MAAPFKVKVEKWDLGFPTDGIAYQAVISLGRLHFVFSVGDDVLHIELPRDTTYRVIEEGYYYPMLLAIIASRDEQGLDGSVTWRVWDTPLLPGQWCYAIFGPDECVEFAGEPLAVTLLKDMRVTDLAQKLVQKECLELKRSDVDQWIGNPNPFPGKEALEPFSIRIKPWDVEPPLQLFAYAGIMAFFDNICLLFTDGQNSFVHSFNRVTPFRVTGESSDRSLRKSIESIRIKESLPSRQSWLVWHSPFTTELNSCEDLFLLVPDEDRDENVILTATHDIEFLGGQPYTEFFPKTGVEAVMLKKFEQARTREAAYRAGQFELI